MSKPVMHFELVANDPKKLRSFFTTLFGWGVEEYAEMGYSMLHTRSDKEKAGIDGGIGGASKELPAGLALYVQVEDVEKHLARALELGAKVLQQPYDVPGVGRMALFADPEGNRVGLWKVAG